MLLLKVWYVSEVSKYFQEDTLGIDLKCSISGLALKGKGNAETPRLLRVGLMRCPS